MSDAEAASRECPSEDVLVGYVEAALDAEGAIAFEAHLDRCVACSEIIASFGREYDDEDAVLPLVPGATMGRYRLLEPVGRGAMGVVWAAYDPDLDRRVALKVLRWTDDLDHGEARAAMLAEAKSMARLTDPAVITVHDVGADGQRVFVAMEFVDGPTLTQWLATPRSVDEILRVFLGAARGLAAAHAQGVVHGDFKPDNVLVDRLDRPRVADFGLSRIIAEATHDEPPEATGHRRAFVGTPLYMAPEQFAGLPATARSDQFSFCVALWQALFDTRPFAGATVPEIAAAVSTGALVEPPRAVALPKPLRTAMRRGLAADPGGRHADMGPIIDVLARGRARAPRWPWVVGAAASVAIALAAASGRDPSDACAPPPWLRASFTTPLQDDPARLPYERTAAKRLEQALLGAQRRLLDVHRTSCEASSGGTQSDDAHARVTACLEVAAAALAPLREAARDPTPGAVWRALVVVDASRDLDCDDPVRLASALPWPDDQARRDEAVAHAAALAEGLLLIRLARFQDARARAQAVLDTADAAMFPGQRAAALRLLALAQDRLGAGDPVALLDESLALALASGEEREAFDTLRELVFVQGVRRGRRDDAELYARIAAPLAERSGRGALGRAVLWQNLGSARTAAAEPEAALAALGLAVAEREASGGLDDAQAGSLLLARGLAHEGRDDFDAAIADYARAHRVYADALGEDHPHVGMALEYLGIVYRKRGDTDAAIAALTASIAVRTAALGPAHVDTATALHALASVQLEIGRADEAERNLVAATGSWRATGTRDRRLAMGLANLGEALRRRGALDRAEVVLDESLAIYEENLGTDPPELGFTLLGLGLVALDRGQRETALRALTRAMRLAGDHGDPMLRAEIGGALARAQPPEARWLAQTQAILALALASTSHTAAARRTRDEIRQWLAPEPLAVTHHEGGLQPPVDRTFAP